MAISTIGSDGLATGAVTSTKLTSGVPTRSQLPAGTVLQVVQDSASGQTLTTSTTYTATGLAATITPTSATSKVLVLVSGGDLDNTSAERQMYVTIYRNSTNLSNPYGFTDAYSSARAIGSCSMAFLDSPNTTASTTYQVYIKSNTSGQQVGFNTQGSSVRMTLMEIAA